jgi:hypothetical protein
MTLDAREWVAASRLGALDRVAGVVFAGARLAQKGGSLAIRWERHA